jgi:hypothetical protein
MEGDQKLLMPDTLIDPGAKKGFTPVADIFKGMQPDSKQAY